MVPDDHIIEICTVSKIARELGLSRARFYQLQKQGVFPLPIYCADTKRPFYPLNLKQKCLEIRKTGIGANGKPVMFNHKRKSHVANTSDRKDQRYKELADVLKQMGIAVTPKKVRNAVQALYPGDQKQDMDFEKIITDLFRYFGRKV